MSSMEILERFNDASIESIDVSPKVRKRAINDFLVLFYDAPELKISIISKLEQLTGDADANVANYAKRILGRVQDAQRYQPSYHATPNSTGSEYPRASTGTTRGTAQPPRESKNVIANIVCCIIMIVVYFIMYYFVF